MLAAFRTRQVGARTPNLAVDNLETQVNAGIFALLARSSEPVPSDASSFSNMVVVG